VHHLSSSYLLVMQIEMPNNTSSNSSLHSPSENCFSPETIAIIAALLVVYVFLTPLFVLVLVLGYQKWRKRCFSSPFTSSSHINIFTYNVVVLDLLGISGTFCAFFGTITDKLYVRTAGNCLLCIISIGHMLFHLLTCIERYLAVVHPIFYLQLRGSAGVTMRNIMIGCVWLTSLIVMCATLWLRVLYDAISIVFLFFTSVGFCFSSIFVFCALLHPGPGEGGTNGVHTDQSKQKAFQTMIIITGTLSLRLISNMIALIVKSLSGSNGYIFCVVGWASVWFHLPCSLVLSLLFLQRVGKLKVCG
ncbi:hypothetical protein XENOCAPTIV_009383, partial [Xenoophorus captivus]